MSQGRAKNSPEDRDEDPFTTLTVRKSVVRRLKSSRPYDSMSWNEVLAEMADVYEKQDT